MRIAVFGASGKVGRRVVELALRRGHTVVAVVHQADPFTGTPQLLVRQADIHDAPAVRQALAGSDAVISTLGSWGRPGRNVLTSAMQTIIPAMEAEGIKRIITLTGSGAAVLTAPETTGHALMMKLLRLFPAGRVFADGEQHMRLLAASNLDWTTIRSPIMRSGQRATYQLDLKTGSSIAVVTRDAVASALLDQLNNTDWRQQAPVIHI